MGHPVAMFNNDLCFYMDHPTLRSIWLSKLRTVMLAILAPELIFTMAAEQLTDIKRLMKVCNAAQKERDCESA
ncbi:uncharacterized protein N7479_008990 [Penicillium vulpinum]|uniref:uncharacterized protein n=1 Tax=Penicillium vulpinum TaxID=29845 RepID=UPI002547CB7B|nr:uncharacterized protein N7479_008990 [Penicillium vulpinum]KAJ5950577.1 hypothetical protein N7479_008990 [Penicillium vulpinum]